MYFSVLNLSAVFPQVSTERQSTGLFKYNSPFRRLRLPFRLGLGTGVYFKGRKMVIIKGHRQEETLL